ncbi:hypothetical protein [Niveispirillum sp.]|uniref:hypothetical protein n=1 Tax=Niveispirillum sp. TaxID=1917217 RepID=UPI001B483F3A|nr:hypothetical protein [Niveispirillum sp.]MBP7339731.1 hypothetical protein [Niveispirillum sp.]
MLTRGADGRLYRVAPNGVTVVVEEAQNQTVSRVAARGSMDAGASAEIYSSSAEIYSAKM